MRRQPTYAPWPMSCPPGFHEQMMQQAGWRCERCERSERLTLSHRLARSRGGPFTVWNIDVLCWLCHDFCERNPRQAEREGWRVVGYITRGVYVGPDDVYATVLAEDT